MSTQTEVHPSIASDYPYASRYVEVLGSRMHYVEAGAGDPILFIHGQPTWSYLWRNILPYAAPHGRAVAVDLIGMGKSGKPALAYRYADHLRYLEGFIEALGLHRVVLVVHDWGSILGFDYAMRHENDVRGLAWMEALIPPAFPLPGYEALPGPVQALFRGFRDPVKGRELLIEQNLFIERTGSWLAETALPKLHVYASPGAINPPEVAAWTAAHLKNVETVFVGEGLHFIQEDQPEAIGRALADWLRRLSG